MSSKSISPFPKIVEIKVKNKRCFSKSPVTTNDFVRHIRFYFRLVCFTYLSLLPEVEPFFFQQIHHFGNLKIKCMVYGVLE